MTNAQVAAHFASLDPNQQAKILAIVWDYDGAIAFNINPPVTKERAKELRIDPLEPTDEMLVVDLNALSE